jgi:hypothetical protein
MKKLFIIGAVTIGTFASALQFRTSCGNVVNVANTEGSTYAELSDFLSYVNYKECGTIPKQIIIYTH